MLPPQWPCRRPQSGWHSQRCGLAAVSKQDMQTEMQGGTQPVCQCMSACQQGALKHGTAPLATTPQHLAPHITGTLTQVELTRKSLARSCGIAPASVTLPSRPSVLIICCRSAFLGPSPPACCQKADVGSVSSSFPMPCTFSPSSHTLRAHPGAPIS